jgi:hypothetical protein
MKRAKRVDCNSGHWLEYFRRRFHAASIFQNLNSAPNETSPDEYRLCASFGANKVPPKLTCDPSQLTEVSGLIRPVYTRRLMTKVFREEL